MTRITVLGGTGYTGGNIVREAVARGHEVTSISRTLPEDQIDGVTYRTGDALDADTLELAMQTLDELRQGGRTVGLISHVEAMKDALPAQLVVEATPRGPSVIRQPVGAG